MTPTPATRVAGRSGAPLDGLHPLPDLVRDEPALAQVLGRRSVTVAVPEATRALVVAGLARLSSRRPLVLAVPTSTEAERLGHDLVAYLGEEAVELFPPGRRFPSSG